MMVIRVVIKGFEITCFNLLHNETKEKKLRKV